MATIDIQKAINALKTSQGQMRRFHERHGGMKLFSTDSRVVPYTGVLYNVSGSSDDPDDVAGCVGCSWRELLIKSIPGIEDERCYVDNSEAPDDSSHYDEDINYIGGHMTTIQSGEVETGGQSYLMPLCPWDNHPKRNGDPFQVTDREIVQLDGYMESDLFVTFAARTPARAGEEFGLVHLDESIGVWRYKGISKAEALKLSSANPVDHNQYLLFEKAKSLHHECTLQDARVL